MLFTIVLHNLASLYIDNTIYLYYIYTFDFLQHNREMSN